MCSFGVSPPYGASAGAAVAVTSGCGALTGLLSAADAIEMAVKVATMPNTSADDASNVFMGAPPVMRLSIAERRAVAVTGITNRRRHHRPIYVANRRDRPSTLGSRLRRPLFHWLVMRVGVACTFGVEATLIGHGTLREYRSSPCISYARPSTAIG
jgi:hypothetical protein